MNGNCFPAMVVCGLAAVLMVACAPDTPDPTVGVEPSEAAAIPTATLTPEPTDTPDPTGTPRPTRTPTRTPTPTDTPRPSLGAGPFRAVVSVDDVLPGGIRGLHTTPDGTLWMYSDQAVARLQDDDTWAIFLGVLPGGIRGLHTTADGTLWLYSDQAVARLQDDDTWSIFLPEYAGAFAGIDDLGRVWVADYELAWIAAWDGQDWTWYVEESGWVPPALEWQLGGSVRRGVHIDSSGRLWLATVRDLRAFDGQQWFIYGPEEMGMEPPEHEDIGNVYRIKINQDLIWVGECHFSGGPGPGPGQGLRWFDGEWQGSGLPLDTGCVTVITVAPDGQMWIGQKLTLWQTDPNGEVWTSFTMPDEALGRWNWGYPRDLKVGPYGDVWATYDMCAGAGCQVQFNFYHIEDGIWTLVAEIRPNYHPQLVLGADGTPWIFSFEGIDQVINDVREPVANLYARYTAQDLTGRMWFIAEQDGQNWLWTLDGNE